MWGMGHVADSNGSCDQAVVCRRDHSGRLGRSFIWHRGCTLSNGKPPFSFWRQPRPQCEAFQEWTPGRGRRLAARRRRADIRRCGRPYTLEERLRMDDAFVAAVQSAFRAGLESPQAAGRGGNSAQAVSARARRAAAARPRTIPVSCRVCALPSQQHEEDHRAARL